MSNKEKIAAPQEKLAEAIKLCEYWSKRRQGQVNNCISDQEHETEAWRNRQRLEYQIQELT